MEPMKKSMVPVQVQLDTQVVKVASGECWHAVGRSWQSSVLGLTDNPFLCSLSHQGTTTW